MSKINTNTCRLYNDIRSLISDYDLPAINVSMVVEKIASEMSRIVDGEIQREAKEPDISDLQYDEVFDHLNQDDQENK